MDPEVTTTQLAAITDTVITDNDTATTSINSETHADVSFGCMNIENMILDGTPPISSLLSTPITEAVVSTEATPVIGSQTLLTPIFEEGNEHSPPPSIPAGIELSFVGDSVDIPTLPAGSDLSFVDNSVDPVSDVSEDHSDNSNSNSVTLTVVEGKGKSPSATKHTLQECVVKIDSRDLKKVTSHLMSPPSSKPATKRYPSRRKSVTQKPISPKKSAKTTKKSSTPPTQPAAKTSKELLNEFHGESTILLTALKNLEDSSFPRQAD